MTTPIIDVPAGLTAEQAAVVASQQVFQAQQQQLRAQLAAALIAVWAGVASAQAFNPQAAAKFVASILPISLGAQRAMSAITVAQMNRMVGPPTPIVIAPDAVTGPALRQRDPADYYERPFREVKWRLSQGKPLGEALDAGRRRAESIAQTDLQLAHTHTARSYLDEARARTARRREAWKALPPRERRNTPRPTTGSAGTVVGYRRVLSNRPNHCALCVLASTQRYHRENLMPIHPGCGCTVAPVFSTDDRSDQLVLDPSLAQEVDNIIRRDLGEDYLDRNRSKSKGGRSGPDLYKDIVVTNDHGELGPVLGVRGHHFERDPGRPGHLGHIRVNPKPEAEPDFPDLDVPAQALRSVNAS